MRPAARLWLLACLLGLGGCSLTPPGSATSGGVERANHPHFAPPPGVRSHWDGGLGVYVLEDARGLYYRQRTYYRWDSGWSWASSPQGPWQPTDSSGVPPGLYRRHAQ